MGEVQWNLNVSMDVTGLWTDTSLAREELGDNPVRESHLL